MLGNTVRGWRKLHNEDLRDLSCLPSTSTMVIKIIIIIIIRHRLDLDRPVLASSNCLFKILPSRLPPFGLQFSIIFAVLLLFIRVTCRSQCDLYLLSFWSPVSTFSSFKTSSFRLWSKRVPTAVILKNLNSFVVNCFNLSFFLRIQILLPFKRLGTASALYRVFQKELYNFESL